MVVLTEVFGPSVPAPDLSTARQPRQFAFPFALLPSAASTSQSPFRYTSARLNPAFAYYNFGYQRSAFAPIPSWARLLSTSSGLGPNLSVGQQSTTAGPSAPATSFFLPRSASDVFVRPRSLSVSSLRSESAFSDSAADQLAAWFSVRPFTLPSPSSDDDQGRRPSLSDYFRANPVDFANPPPVFQRVDSIESIESLIENISLSHSIINHNMSGPAPPGAFPDDHDTEPVAEFAMPHFSQTHVPQITTTSSPATAAVSPFTSAGDPFSTTATTEEPFQWSAVASPTATGPEPTIEQKYTLEATLRESAELQVHLLKDLGGRIMSVLEKAGLCKGFEDAVNIFDTPNDEPRIRGALKSLQENLFALQFLGPPHTAAPAAETSLVTPSSVGTVFDTKSDDLLVRYHEEVRTSQGLRTELDAAKEEAAQSRAELNGLKVGVSYLQVSYRKLQEQLARSKSAPAPSEAPSEAKTAVITASTSSTNLEQVIEASNEQVEALESDLEEIKSRLGSMLSPEPAPVVADDAVSLAPTVDDSSVRAERAEKELEATKEELLKTRGELNGLKVGTEFLRYEFSKMKKKLQEQSTSSAASTSTITEIDNIAAQEELLRTQEELKTIKERVSALLDEAHEGFGAEAELRKKLEDKSEELFRTRGELAGLKVGVEFLRHEYSVLRTKLAASAAQSTAPAEQPSDADQQISELKAQLQAKEDEIAKIRKGLKGAVERLQGGASARSEIVTVSPGSVKTLLQAAEAQSGAELVVPAAAVTVSVEEVDTLKTKLTAKDDELQKTRAELAGLKVGVDYLRHEYNKLKDVLPELARTKEELSSTKEELAATKERVWALLDEAHDGFGSEIELRSKLAQKDEELLDKTEDLNRTRAELNGLKVGVDYLRYSYNKLKAAAAAAEAKSLEAATTAPRSLPEEEVPVIAAEVASATESPVDFQAQLAAKEGELLKTRAELNGLKVGVDYLRHEYGELKKRLEEQRVAADTPAEAAEVAAAEADIQRISLEEELVRTKEELNTIKGRVSALLDEAHEGFGTETELRKIVEGKDEELLKTRAELNGLKVGVDYLRHEYQSLRKELAETKANQAPAETSSDLQAQLAAKDEELLKTRAELNGLKVGVEYLQYEYSKLREASAQIKSAEATATDLQAQVSSKDEELLKTRAELNGLKVGVDYLRYSYNKLKAAAATAKSSEPAATTSRALPEEEIPVIAAEVGSVSEPPVDFQAQLEAKDKELKKTRAELAGLKVGVDYLRHSYNRLKDVVPELERTKEELAATKERVWALLDEAHDGFGSEIELRSKLAQKDEELLDKTQDLNRTRAELAGLKVGVDYLRHSYNKLKVAAAEAKTLETAATAPRSLPEEEVPVIAAEVASATESPVDFQAQLAAKDEEIMKTRAELAGLKVGVDYLRHNYNRLKDGLPELARTKEELSSTKEELAATKERVWALLDEAHDGFGSEIELRSKLAQKDEENLNIRAELAGLKVGVQYLRHKYSKLKKKLETAPSAAADVAVVADTAASRSLPQETGLDSINNTTGRETQHSPQETDPSALPMELDLVAQSAERVGAETRSEALRTELQSARDAVKAVEAEIVALGKQVEAEAMRKSQLMAQMDELQADLASAFESAQALETEVNTLRDELDIEVGRKIALLSKSQDVRQGLEETRASNQAVEAEISAMEKQMADSTAAASSIPPSSREASERDAGTGQQQLLGLEAQLAGLPAHQYEAVAQHVAEVKAGVEQLKAMLLQAAEEIAARDFRIEELEAGLAKATQLAEAAAVQAPVALGTGASKETLEKLAKTLEGSKLFEGFNANALMVDQDTPVATMLINTTLALINARLQHLSTTSRLEGSLIPTLERLASQLQTATAEPIAESTVRNLAPPGMLQQTDSLATIAEQDMMTAVRGSSGLSQEISLPTLTVDLPGSLSTDPRMKALVIPSELTPQAPLVMSVEHQPFVVQQVETAEDILRRRNRVLERQIKDARNLLRTMRMLLHEVMESGAPPEYVTLLAAKIERMQQVLVSDLDVRAEK